MKIGYYQFAPIFGEVEKNINRVRAALSTADADLMVLPELFSTGYQFVSKEEALGLSEEIPGGPACRALEEIAAEKQMHIVAGLAERAGDRCYNSAALVGPNGVIGAYRKTHLFFEETLWFTPGDTGFHVYDIGTARLGLMVCFDWYFPESARTLALKGADILCHPSNLVLPNCPDAMITRCLENRVFSVTCNRTGYEERGGKPRLTFIGKGRIVSPKGEVLATAPTEGDELAVVEVDPLLARDKSLNVHNDLFKARRPEMYELG